MRLPGPPRSALRRDHDTERLANPACQIARIAARLSAHDPRPTAADLRAARALREALWRLAQARIEGRLLAPADRPQRRWRHRLDLGAAIGGLGVGAASLLALLVSERTPLFGFMEHGYRPVIVLAIAVPVAAWRMLDESQRRRYREIRRRQRGQLR